MKTEGLTWAEAIKAYANGERVRDKNNCEYWLDGNSAESFDPFGDIPKCPEPWAEPFCIVKPEPKRLTMDEALDALHEKKRILIKMPRGVARFRGDEDTDFEAVAILYVAEQKGWPIQEVKR